jgi:hypothetical protein
MENKSAMCRLAEFHESYMAQSNHWSYDEIIALARQIARERDDLCDLYGRYKKLRKLNFAQFSDLYKRNLAGEGTFDDLVDKLEPNDKAQGSAACGASPGATGSASTEEM